MNSLLVESPPIHPVSWRQHIGAAAILALAGIVSMRGWFVEERMPLADFPANAALIEYVRNSLLRHGRVPMWSSEFFGGTTYFVGSFSQYLAFPMALWLDPVLATKLMFLILRLLSAVGLYGIFAYLFQAPGAGILAGYAYGFGACANHETGHFDVAVSSFLFPAVFLASVELLRRRSWCWAAALGCLVASVLSNSFVQAWLCPAMFLLVLAMRPWRPEPTAENPLRVPRLAARWTVLAGLALCTFLLVSASQLAWLAADARNHAFFSPEEAAAGQKIYVERSPFLFVNRDNWMGSWLREHQPPGFDLSEVDGGRRYLGLVAIAVCVCGWFALRQQFALRRWYQTALLLFLTEYWLSLGPRTVLWQVARSFKWTDALEARVRLLLILGAIALGVSALRLLERHWRSVTPVVARRTEFLLGLTLLFSFPTFSPWQAIHDTVPVFTVQRSPGHFFDVAPFSFYLLFGLSVTALCRRLRTRGAVRGLLVSLGILIVVDFWPSTRAFSVGAPMEPLQRGRQMLEVVPGEGATLRMGFAPIYSPIQTWLAAGSDLGRTWSWVEWQAGKYWPAYLGAAAWHFRPVNASPEEREREVDTALLALGRIRYFLIDAQDPRMDGWSLPPPWKPIATDGRFSLWEQPHVAPMASGHRSYIAPTKAGAAIPAEAVARAFVANVLVIAPNDTLPVAPSTGDEDAADVSEQIVLYGATESGTWGPLHSGADWSRAMGEMRTQPLLQVSYRRPAPERIVLGTNAGSQPAIIFVSEGYHPWWRATVDGEPAEVLRAQMAFMAIRVTPGFHIIEMRLERPGLVAAADWITTSSWLGLGVVVLYGAVTRGWRRSLAPRRSSAPLSGDGPAEGELPS